MARRLEDITAWERVRARVQEMSNEEMEIVACRILGELYAKALYVREDTHYFEKIKERATAEAEEWAKANRQTIEVSRRVLRKDRK